MSSMAIKFLISLKNASSLKKEVIKVFFNKNFILLAKFLYQQGLIQDFWVEYGINARLVVALKYHYNYSCISTLKIISKPSRSIFFSYKDIFKLYEKHVIYIFSTDKGYFTSIECKKNKIGGFLAFYVK